MKFGEFIRADVCQVAVQQIPAHKATLYHRRRKVAEKRLHECKGYSWGTAETLSCMYTSNYTVTSTCMGGVLLCLFFHCLFRKWRRHKSAYPNASRYVSYASAVYFKISGKVCKIWRRNKRALGRKIFYLKIWCLVRYYLLYGKLYRVKKQFKKWLIPLVHRVTSAYYYMRVAFSIYCHLPPLRVSAVVIFLGLFMSGNIELNPGPKEGHLTLSDLRVVRKAIWGARSKWFSLGIELSITVASLEAIKQKNKENADDCLTEMLLEWLRQANPKPTWACIVAALREPTVGLEQLAESIEKEYLIIEGIHGMECTTSESEASCSGGIKLGKRQTRGELCFPHINEIAPDKEQRKALEERLHIESKEMMYKFYILINKFFDSLEEQAIPAQKLERYLRMPLETEKLTISSVQDAQRIIENNSSFYDYQLVEYMIEVTGTESDKQALQKYIESFTHYAQRRVFECPAELATRARTPGDVKLMIKLDAHYKWKLTELKEFQKRICRILQIPFYVSKLHCVKKGCFKITFLVASYNKESTFPLTPDQKAALVKLKVIRLVCGKYQEDFRREMDYDIALDSGSDSDSDDDVNCSNPVTKSISCETTALDDITRQISAELVINTSSMEQVVMTDEPHSSRGERRSSIGRSERRRQTGRSAASPASTPPFTASPTTASPTTASPTSRPLEMSSIHNFYNRYQWSHDLLLAAANGDELRVAILINLLGADVSYKDSKGNSALHFATEYGHLKVIMCLIEHGADITDQGQGGMSLLHIAAKFGHMHIIHYLIREHNFNPFCFDHCNHTPFFVACIYNRLEIAHYLLTSLSLSKKYETLEEVYINSTDVYGESVVHTTCKMGHTEIVRWLTSGLHCDSSKIIIPSSIKRLPLHYAAEFGHVHIVKLLIENQGCNSSCTDSNGATPLLLASRNGHLDIVKYLTVDRNCDPEVGDNDNVTPLHVAAMNGRYDVTKFFISELNCDPNIRGWKQSGTPLHVAAQGGHLCIVKYLIEEKHCNPSCQDANKVTPLHLASLNGHLLLVTYLSLKCDPTIRDSENVTPLHYAAINGHYNVTRYLVSKLNCDPNIQGWKQSRTPLHVAAQEGHLRIIRYLVEENYCNPSCQDVNKITPLHLASINGHLDIVRYLTVDRNCDPAVRNNENATPLHFAAGNGHYEVVRFLISELNCDPNSRGWKTKRTPLHDAAQEGYLDIVKYLIKDKGCDSSCQDINQVTPLHLASLNGHLNTAKYLITVQKCNAECRDVNGITPVLLASMNGHLELVKHLVLDKSCDPMSRTKDCNTPLHSALYNGHIDVVKFFISDMNCDPNVPGFRGMTPLHYAIHSGNINLVKYMIEDVKCHLHTLDNFNRTPIMLAIKSLPCLKYLCEKHCDPTSRTILGETMLHFAVREGRHEVIDYLVKERYFDLNTQGWTNRTPLHCAAECGHLDLLKYLISEYNCQATVTDANGDTPLHFAALQGHLPIVKHLTLDLNCDPLQTDIYGNTPLHDAARNGHLEVVKFLIETLRCPTDMKGSCHMIPLEWAFFKGHFHIIKYLCQANTKMISSELDH